MVDNMRMKISIQDMKAIRENMGMTHLVVFAIAPDGSQHVATHGETECDAKEAANAGNNLKHALGWPDELCRDKPLQRIHENCAFYEVDWGLPSFNGWTGDGKKGFCYIERKKVNVAGKEKACKDFQPKN